MNTLLKINLALLIAINFVITNAFAQQGPPPAPVKVAKVVEKKLAPTTLIPGIITSLNSANIAAEVSGNLTWVAEVGTKIKTGMPIAKIEDTYIKLQIEEQHAIINREQARLKFSENELKRLKKLAENNNAAKNSV